MPRLNDAEAMPLAESDAELLEDLCRAPRLLRHVFAGTAAPPALGAALDGLQAACEPQGMRGLTADWLADQLISAVEQADLSLV